MAPGAQWIACRNMRNGFGTPGAYSACFEFFFAPYPQDGDPFTDGEPAKAPHIINNSWSCPSNEGCDVDTLRQVVEWRWQVLLWVALVVFFYAKAFWEDRLLAEKHGVAWFDYADHVSSFIPRFWGSR